MRSLVVLLVLALAGKARAQAEAPDVAPVRLLTLADALRTARKSSPIRQQARGATEAAEARVTVSRAPLLPQLTGTAGYQRTTANFVPRPGSVPRAITGTQPPPSFDTFNFYSFGATASQLVYDFGVLSSALGASKETAKAQLETERATGLDVDLSVRTAFFRAHAQKALLAVARGALANQERHRAQAEALVEVGTRPAIDVAQARTDVANARVALIRAENAYAIAKAELNQALGVEDATDYDVSDEELPRLPMEDAATEVLLASAFENRPDLAALDGQLRARELNQRAIKGGYGPSLSVSTTLSDAGTKLDDLTWNWNAGVFLSWPLLSGGATLGQVREQRAMVSSIAAERDALRLAVRLALERARLELRAAKAVIDATNEAVAAAHERLALAEGRYAAGVGNIIELGDAQLALQEAEAQRVAAAHDLSTARAVLLNALGRAE